MSSRSSHGGSDTGGDGSTGNVDGGGGSGAALQPNGNGVHSEARLKSGSTTPSKSAKKLTAVSPPMDSSSPATAVAVSASGPAPVIRIKRIQPISQQQLHPQQQQLHPQQQHTTSSIDAVNMPTGGGITTTTTGNITVRRGSFNPQLFPQQQLQPQQDTIESVDVPQQLHAPIAIRRGSLQTSRTIIGDGLASSNTTATISDLNPSGMPGLGSRPIQPRPGGGGGGGGGGGPPQSIVVPRLPRTATMPIMPASGPVPPRPLISVNAAAAVTGQPSPVSTPPPPPLPSHPPRPSVTASIPITSSSPQPPQTALSSHPQSPSLQQHAPPMIYPGNEPRSSIMIKRGMTPLNNHSRTTSSLSTSHQPATQQQQPQQQQQQQQQSQQMQPIQPQHSAPPSQIIIPLRQSTLAAHDAQFSIKKGPGSVASSVPLRSRRGSISSQVSGTSLTARSESTMGGSFHPNQRWRDEYSNSAVDASAFDQTHVDMSDVTKMTLLSFKGHTDQESVVRRLRNTEPRMIVGLLSCNDGAKSFLANYITSGPSLQPQQQQQQQQQQQEEWKGGSNANVVELYVTAEQLMVVDTPAVRCSKSDEQSSSSNRDVIEDNRRGRGGQRGSSQSSPDPNMLRTLQQAILLLVTCDTIMITVDYASLTTDEREYYTFGGQKLQSKPQSSKSAVEIPSHLFDLINLLRTARTLITNGIHGVHMSSDGPYIVFTLINAPISFYQPEHFRILSEALNSALIGSGLNALGGSLCIAQAAAWLQNLMPLDKQPNVFIIPPQSPLSSSSSIPQSSSTTTAAAPDTTKLKRRQFVTGNDKNTLGLLANPFATVKSSKKNTKSKTVSATSRDSNIDGSGVHHVPFGTAMSHMIGELLHRRIGTSSADLFSPSGRGGSHADASRIRIGGQWHSEAEWARYALRTFALIRRAEQIREHVVAQSSSPFASSAFPPLGSSVTGMSATDFPQLQHSTTMPVGGRGNAGGSPRHQRGGGGRRYHDRVSG
ncbi:hypothetical protein GQ42DRAFT_156855 [Ramicandelaber brevisporus]|nr:hypothetical protein GQ42DRAFT_156855 [Ramicandelaber brevisporus]